MGSMHYRLLITECPLALEHVYIIIWVYIITWVRAVLVTAIFSSLVIVAAGYVSTIVMFQDIQMTYCTKNLK